MDSQSQQSCDQLANFQALNTALDGAFSRPSRGILQERSANRSLDHQNNIPSPLKGSRSPSPEDRLYTGGLATHEYPLTRNTHFQNPDLFEYHVERPEKEVRYDLERLNELLASSERYQKYRENQPVMTPDEVRAREEQDLVKKKAEEQRGICNDKKVNGKDKSVWPDFLESAFWKGEAHMPPHNFPLDLSKTTYANTTDAALDQT